MTTSHPAGSGGAGRPRLRFDGFELRLDSGELLRAGKPVKLQPQPAKVLEVLARRSGEVVSREEIRRAVWHDAFGDFDASLNFAIKEIRRALGDSAASPAFVETVPRHGYRFLKPLESAPEAAPRRRPWSRLGALGISLLFLIPLTLLTGSRLGPGAKAHAAKPPTAVKPAYEAYLRGVYLARHEQLEPAAAALQEATLLDPGFAAAYAELALVRLQPGPAMPDVAGTEAAARRALALDRNLAGAHLALGRILLYHYRDWEKAGQEFQAALTLAPDNAEAHHQEALYLASLGWYRAAIEAGERARELDPASMLVGSDDAWLFYLDHRYEEAIRRARAALQLYPVSLASTPVTAETAWKDCLRTLLLSAWKLGDRQTALGAAQEVLSQVPGRQQEAARLASVEEYWRGRERRIEAAMQTRTVDPFYRAENALLLGDRERALDLLTRHCEPPQIWNPFAAADRVFDDLHADPRWSRVLDCLKLPAGAPVRTQRWQVAERIRR